MAKTAKQKSKRPRPVRRTSSKSGRKSSPKRKGDGFLGMSPLSLVLYGPSGVGKTSFAAHFPKPGFIIDPQEEGIVTLSEFKLCPKPRFIQTATDYEKLYELLADVASGESEIETLVLDSLTGFEKLCFISHCDEYFDGNWSSKGFYSYQQGPKNAAKIDWPPFLSALDEVRGAGVDVVLIAHSSVKNYNNPEGADYDRFNAYLDKEIWQATHRWAKGVLFYNYHVEVDRKAGIKNKADPASERRHIYTEWSPAYDAKNQYGLEPLIEAGDDGQEAFDNFQEAFKEAANK